MEKNDQTKHLFLAIAIITAVFAPILYFFLPQTVADIVHHKENVFFVSVPDENFTVFAFGYGFIFLAAITLFLLNIRKLSIIISIIFLCLALTTFFIGSQSYRALATDHISYSPLFSFEKETYSWDEVTEVIRYRDEIGDKSEYAFVFADGNQMKIKDNRYLRDASYKFNKKLQEENLSVEFKLIE